MNETRLKWWLLEFIKALNKKHIRPNAVVLAKRTMLDIDRIMHLLHKLWCEDLIKPDDGCDHKEKYEWPWIIKEE